MTVKRLQLARAAAWTPYSIPLSLRPLYVSAADLAATPVDTWTGRHGGLSFTASTTARPAWSATGFAGAYPGVTADGVANVMTAAATTGLPTGTDSCVVAALVEDFITGMIVSWGGTTSPTYRRVFVSSNGITFNLHGGTQSAVWSVAPLDPTIIVGIATGIGTASPLLVLRANGTEVARYTGDLAGTTGTTRARLFATTLTTPSTFGVGTIAELLIGTTWTDETIYRFEGYCAHAYPAAGIALPDGHPYRSGAP